ncbi:cytochrome P450 [Niveispirillum cyanobacteriorum]|uniref:Cytochrome P450 n=1 Tax=Niveispirillum cyanobacteriorum TaxID=1612173 RepID=A0A2K9N7G5_9PROT|nr:cytochrome P450 [Niveispirillum cyanobacteriorum]AUN29024.1 cytochrome P450 [Niveispirillum cyanobacteriorum]GGE68236.1 cytochrome P450 monooxygenase [Niveispirillum cyanobacteriorum]
MPSDFNPLLPEDFDSPHADYRRLREQCPVAHSDAWGGFWALMKHADVAAAAADSATFITSKQNVVPKVAFTGRRPPLHLDPPEHTPYRRALAPLLTERRLQKLEPMIRRICGELLDPLIAKGHGDICADFSSRMPVLVFANWMNLPPDQVDELADLGRRYNVAVQSADMDETKETSLLLYDMACAIVADRKANPQDPTEDATSALLAVRVDGEPLPEEMIVGCIRQVLVVGIIAPTVMVGSMAVHLSRHPDLQSYLRANRDKVPAATDEFLRLYTPYRGFARTATQDVTIRGRTIPAGEPIALVYASANRDADIFPEPETFRLDRPNMKESLAFGRGTHSCVGAALGRLELSVALDELLARTKGFSVDGPIVPTRFPEIGALKVPLRFE